MDSSSSSTQRVRTRGLNHVNLVVADVGRSRRFYEEALGFEYVNEEAEITFMTTPGVGDSLALQQSGGDLDRLSGKRRSPGEMGGVDHIGFAVDPEAIDDLIDAVERAGGSLLMRKTRESAFVVDPDGYVLQLG